jgi:hypothetical protein
MRLKARNLLIIIHTKNVNFITFIDIVSFTQTPFGAGVNPKLQYSRFLKGEKFRAN